MSAVSSSGTAGVLDPFVELDPRQAPPHVRRIKYGNRRPELDKADIQNEAGDNV
jgi:hypothetical protein